MEPDNGNGRIYVRRRPGIYRGASVFLDSCMGYFLYHIGGLLYLINLKTILSKTAYYQIFFSFFKEYSEWYSVPLHLAYILKLPLHTLLVC